MDQIHLFHDKDKSLNIVNRITNLRMPYMAENVWIS